MEFSSSIKFCAASGGIVYFAYQVDESGNFERFCSSVKIVSTGRNRYFLARTRQGEPCGDASLISDLSCLDRVHILQPRFLACWLWLLSLAENDVSSPYRSLLPCRLTANYSILRRLVKSLGISLFLKTVLRP